MEVQAPTLQMLMPPWGFVLQNCTTRGSRLQSIHLWIVKIFVIDCFLQHWALEWANHPPWTSRFQEIKFIRDLPNFKIACWNLGAYLLACKSPASSATRGLCTTVWWLAVKDCEVGTEKVRTAIFKVENGIIFIWLVTLSLIIPKPPSFYIIFVRL